jgi:hypothetical protein
MFLASNRLCAESLSKPLWLRLSVQLADYPEPGLNWRGHGQHLK